MVESVVFCLSRSWLNGRPTPLAVGSIQAAVLLNGTVGSVTVNHTAKPLLPLGATKNTTGSGKLEGIFTLRGVDYTYNSAVCMVWLPAELRYQRIATKPRYNQLLIPQIGCCAVLLVIFATLYLGSCDQEGKAQERCVR